MPIKVQTGLPAIQVLESENIFVMPEDVALRQDIRPLKIVILNLMPNKIETETQLLRLMGNSPLQVDVELLQMATHQSKNTSNIHLTKFYKVFNDIRNQKFDGMIITGAPVEQLKFEDVDYWQELTEIMEWSKRNVYSTLHICWGAQAGLYYHYGIPKYTMEYKLSGIFQHRVLNPNPPLMRGFDDRFVLPHSRYTGVHRDDIYRIVILVHIPFYAGTGIRIRSRSGFIRQLNRPVIRNPEICFVIKNHIPLRSQSLCQAIYSFRQGGEFYFGD